MLKSLIFILVSGMTLSTFAQNVAPASSRYDGCVNALEYYFLASHSEASTVCRQNTTPEFMRCMIQRGQNTTQHVLDAAMQCSPRRNRVQVPVESSDPTYNNFRSCPNRLQVDARMNEDRSRQICDWDPSTLMQNCIVDLVRQARFHSEHAIQYCGFANTEYRNKIPSFVACVIDNARRGYDVYSNVRMCDDEMTRGRRYKPRPVETRPVNPRQDTGVQPTPETRPVQPVPQEKPQDTKQEPARTSGGRKVPTPVDIKIEESSNPDVNDQPLNTGTTSNSEALPM